MIKNASPRAEVPDPHVLHRTAPPNSGREENIIDLLKQLAGQGSHLAEQQLALIKAEMRESTSELKAAAGAMGAAAVVGIAGLGVTLMGIADFVGQAIDNLALGTVIVGLVTLVLAYVFYRGGARKMSVAKLAPDRTERTLKRTPDAVRGDLPTGERP
jgi:uncharacterized protein YbjQ (UPF0145 family)